MTYYLKYRPQKLIDLDIFSVRDTLEKIVKSKNIPHAFLFAGPKGTGKTSAARILAKMINCESKNAPCNKCSQCTSITNGTNMDVIEMDGASNRGIDDIRALRDVVKLAPTNAKSKIYIIDEAHMLTTEASNALLKTLEEPPSHVYFILATTNPEKLIETIKSRATLVSFTKATSDEIVRSLKRVVKGEKLKITDGDLKIIAKISKGSFRDAVKILEQIDGDKDFLSNIKYFDSDNFLELLSNKDLKKCLGEIKSAVNYGVSVEIIIESILEKLRLQLLALSGIGMVEYGFNKVELIYLIELLIHSEEDIKVSPIEELPLELVIIKWIGDEVILEKPKKKLKEVDSECWGKVLSEVKSINASIEVLLRSSKLIGLDEQKLKIGVYYKFHKDKLEETKNKKMLEDIASKIFEKTIRVECLLTEKKDDNILTVAEEIFNV